MKRCMGEILTLSRKCSYFPHSGFLLLYQTHISTQPNPFDFLSFHCIRASCHRYLCFFLLSGRSHQSCHSSCQGFLPILLHSCIRIVNIRIYLTRTSICLTVNQQLRLVFRSSDLFSDQIAPGIIWAHYQSITMADPQFQKILKIINSSNFLLSLFQICLVH